MPGVSELVSMVRLTFPLLKYCPGKVRISLPVRLEILIPTISGRSKKKDISTAPSNGIMEMSKACFVWF
jgi:hypothetical protein